MMGMNRLLLNALNDLNHEFSQKKIKIKLIICGAFAIEMHGFSRVQETIDIDTYLRIDNEIRKIISAVGIRNGIKSDWLNDQVSDITPPEGFEKRLVEINQWSNIFVQLMSVEDLIKMKVAAWFTRGQATTKDYEDLIVLKATRQQIVDGVEYAKKSLKYEELPLKFKKQFDQTVQEFLDVYGK